LGIGTSNGVHTFKVHVIESGKSGLVWCGLTTQQCFGSGWKLKGLMYGGNTSDGGGLLRSSFGPSLEQGDVFDVLCVIENRTMSVYFKVNGDGLGKAFEIDLNNASQSSFHPALSFSSGPARVSLTMDGDADIDSYIRKPISIRSSIAGEWAVEGGAIVKNGHSLPNVVLVVDTSTWSVSARVANSMTVKISETAPHRSLGGPMTTMMMPPEYLQELETSVSQMLSSIEDLVLLTDSNRLQIKHHGDQELTFKSYTELFEPAKNDEIRWLLNVQ